MVCVPKKFKNGRVNEKAGKWHNHFPKKHWTEIATKEEIIAICKKGQGSYVNAMEYFKRRIENEKA